jgi:hypothetical protein
MRCRIRTILEELGQVFCLKTFWWLSNARRATSISCVSKVKIKFATHSNSAPDYYLRFRISATHPDLDRSHVHSSNKLYGIKYTTINVHWVTGVRNEKLKILPRKSTAQEGNKSNHQRDDWTMFAWTLSMVPVKRNVNCIQSKKGRCMFSCSVRPFGDSSEDQVLWKADSSTKSARSNCGCHMFSSR